MKRIKIYKLIKSFIIDKQTKEGLTMNKYKIEQLDHKTNYKMKALYEYFLCEKERANKKKQKRKEMITNILEFLFTLLMFFCFWLLLVLVNI